MEVISRATIAMVAAVFVMLAAAFPAAVAKVDMSVPAPAPAPTSDGTTIDQGIAYVLMLLALILTYIMH